MDRSALRGMLLAALTVTCGAAIADPVTFYWTDWTGSDVDAGAGFEGHGTITTPTSTVDVVYKNPNGVGFYQNGDAGQTDWWVNRGGQGALPSPYTSSLVANRPTGTDMIALRYAGTQTLSFSEAIANPVFAFVSLNGNGYAFDQDFEILSVGGEDGHACGYWGCGGVEKVVVDLGGGQFEYQLNASNVGGSEPHGTIRFTGTFDAVSWRSKTNEYWNGFTVGVQGTADEVCQTDPTLPGCTPGGGGGGNVPEPASLALAGFALVGLVAARRRRPIDRTA